MNAKMIVILMMAVLATLFIWSKFYRKKEQVISKLEVESFEAIQIWLKNKTEQTKKDAIEKTVALSLAQGLTPEKAMTMAENQISSLSV